MQEQLSQITEKMESYGQDVEEWIAKDDATVDGLKRVVQHVKRQMEEVADANLHHCTLYHVEMLTSEEQAEWSKLREKRNTPAARQARSLMARYRE